MKKIMLIILTLGMMHIASAAHFIVGDVRNAMYGEDANGKEVVLWNPANGIDDNLTDVIGVLGNSGSDNIYMIDCELLISPCDVGQELMIKVMDYPANIGGGQV